MDSLLILFILETCDQMIERIESFKELVTEQREEAGYTVADEPAVEPGDTKPFDARKLIECLEDEG